MSTENESEKAVRLARIAALTEEVFGDDVKAGRWLRKPKAKLNGHSPLESLQSQEGACLVEAMLLQLDNGFAA
jgi:putative toxin-antitoxin system antitoxin component (TIGR02293 family)